MQLMDALDRFLVQLRADGRSPHTVGQYRRHVRLLASWARTDGVSREIEDIGHEDLARFLTSPEARSRPDGRRKKAASTNALRTSLRMFFSYCYMAGFAPENAARLIRRARCGSPPPKALSEDEQRRLVEYLAKADNRTARRDEVMYRLMLDTGIRVGSALGLDVEDIDMERGEIRLRCVKDDREETVFIPGRLAGILSLYIGGRADGPLLIGPSGRRLSQRHAQRRFREVLAKAGIRRSLSCHSLRHSFAMQIYKRTHDVLVVQRALCHRSLLSSMIYAQADEDTLRQAIGA